jgi:ribosome-associated heat shock protein Hsp15
LEPARLDKWLFVARIVRTRALAQKLAREGHVRVNGQRAVSAGRQVQPGDVLTVSLPGRVRVLRVVDTGERRGDAAAGAALYEEIAGD